MQRYASTVRLMASTAKTIRHGRPKRHSSSGAPWSAQQASPQAPSFTFVAADLMVRRGSKCRKLPRNWSAEMTKRSPFSASRWRVGATNARTSNLELLETAKVLLIQKFWTRQCWVRVARHADDLRLEHLDRLFTDRLGDGQLCGL